MKKVSKFAVVILSGIFASAVNASQIDGTSSGYGTTYGSWEYHTWTYINFHTKSCHYKRNVYNMPRAYGWGADWSYGTEYKSITISSWSNCPQTL